nr:hypothetical protein GCM10020093_096930 [Planobispora longispora]
MLTVLRRRDFRLVYAAMATSLLGDASLLLIPAILAKKLTGSDGAAGLTLLFFTLPLCVSPLFGWVIDRFDRRRFLVGACLASAAGIMPLAAVSGPDTVWLAYLASAAMGCSYTAVFGALNGLLKSMLPERLLVDANSVLQVTRQGLRLVGPLLGVAVYTGFGLWAAVLLDAATFVAAALAFAALPPGPPAALPPGPPAAPPRHGPAAPPGTGLPGPRGRSPPGGRSGPACGPSSWPEPGTSPVSRESGGRSAPSA